MRLHMSQDHQGSPLCISPLYFQENLAVWCKIWNLLIVLSCFGFTVVVGFGANSHQPFIDDYVVEILESAQLYGVGLLWRAAFVLDTMSAIHQSLSFYLPYPAVICLPFLRCFICIKSVEFYDNLKVCPLLFPNPSVLQRHCLLPAVP